MGQFTGPRELWGPYTIKYDGLHEHEKYVFLQVNKNLPRYVYLFFMIRIDMVFISISLRDSAINAIIVLFCQIS